MPTAAERASTTPTTSENQQLQAELVEEAMKIAGVAEAVAVYGAVRPYAGSPVLHLGAKATYATGGNA